MMSAINALRDSIGRGMVWVAWRLASDLGWSRIANRYGAPNMMGGLLALRDRGFVPEVTVDVGACQGDWTRLLLKVFPETRVLMVEPQPRHEETLKAFATERFPQVAFAKCLLGPPSMKVADFIILDDAAGGTGSSVLPELSAVPRHRIEMPVRTLDEVLGETNTQGPDLVKLDVQGFELEVLKGAVQALQTARYVLLEASVQQYNEGSPLLHDVVAWMDARGFRVVDICDLSPDRSGRLLQVDLLFGRTS